MKVRNILLLTYWSYKDGLVQSTLIHVKLLRKVLPASSWIYLFTLEQAKFRMTEREVADAEKELAQYQIKLIRFNYTSFGLKAMLKMVGMILNLARICFTKNISHIQCWCTPAGAIGYILSVITGKALVVESFEPHAESMVENGTWAKGSKQFKILFLLEKLQAKRAKALIGCVESMQNYIAEKYKIQPKNFTWKPAPVELAKFTHSKKKEAGLINKYGLEDKVTCVYAGKFGGIYLDQEVFDFLAVCQKYWGDQFRLLLLTSHSDKEIESYAKKSGFDTNKMLKIFLPHSEIPSHIGLADFGITPVKPVPTKRYCSPIKDAEYWAMGLPIAITPNISDDSEIIESNQIGTIISDFSEEGYLRNIREIEEILNGNSQLLYEKTRAIAEKYRGEHLTEQAYRQVYSNGSKL
ncbi:MAG: hypothetical protein ACI85I_000028 [Arenicella sp.]|jgi:hypothetical protein